jgi:hypothetical protein
VLAEAAAAALLALAALTAVRALVLPFHHDTEASRAARALRRV